MVTDGDEDLRLFDLRGSEVVADFTGLVHAPFM
nr:hypothetical protein [Tanacetum cinerariifolium]